MRFIHHHKHPIIEYKYIYISRLTIVSREAKKKQPYAMNE